MRTIILLFLTAILFTSCSKEKSSGTTETKKEESTQTKTDSTKPQGSQSQDTKSGETKPAGGIENVSYDIGNIPADMKYEGKVVAGATWKDANGNNTLIITETKIAGTSGDSRHKELYAYHFVTSGGETRQLWKINDFVKDCEFDITLSFIKNSLTVTDINKNGIGESTFLYYMSCKSDVSPDDMKLIMHENDKKYAIRGTAKLTLQGQTYGGEMNVDKFFTDAPEGFLAYAKGEWSKYQTQKSGE